MPLRALALGAVLLSAACRSADVYGGPPPDLRPAPVDAGAAAVPVGPAAATDAGPQLRRPDATIYGAPPAKDR